MTTVIVVRKNGSTVMASDSQVTNGSTIIKSSAKKIKKINNGKILIGLAGIPVDMFNIINEIEKNCNKYDNIFELCLKSVKNLRNKKTRCCGSLLIANNKNILEISGNGEILEPENPCYSIGSGSSWALAIAETLLEYTELSAKDIAKKAILYAASKDIYTNSNVKIEEILI